MKNKEEKIHFQMNLEEAILSILSLQDKPRPAKEIYANLVLEGVSHTFTRTDINRILYKLSEEGKVSSTTDLPALWSLPSESKESVSKPVVMIDLGNVHDILQKIEPYSKKGLVNVYAFCDLAYNGFGVKTKVDPSITVFQATTPDRNAADLHMIWKIAEICIYNKYPGSDILILTRDQGFRTLETITKQYGYKVSFLTSWEELRNFIE